jgi:hypothetical protein
VCGRKDCPCDERSSECRRHGDNFFRVAIYSTGVNSTLKIRVALFVVIVEWQLITTTSSPHCKTEVAFFLAPLPIFPLMFCVFACVYAKRTRLMLLIFFKLRRLSTRLLKLETMTSSAEFELKFRAIEREHGEVHLDEYFPEPIAKMLERTADSLNVPRAFMISGAIMLAASFSPDVYVSGPGSMNESLIFMFLELAPPGSNKSGMCKLLQRTVRHVVSALRLMHSNVETSEAIGIRVCEDSIPAEDRTGTVAAGIRKQTKNRNCFRCEDEYLSFDRMMNQSGGDGMGFLLSAFNGESENVYELSSEMFRAVLPRRQVLAFCQPSVYSDKIAVASDQAGNGFVSRLSPGVGSANLFKTDELFELSDDDSGLCELAMAIASFSIVEHGSYSAYDEDTVDEITKRFSDEKDEDPLSSGETAALFYETHQFNTSILSAGRAAMQLEEHQLTLQKSARMAIQYARAGKKLPARYCNSRPFLPQYAPPLAEGESYLAPLHIEAGRSSVIVLEVKQDSAGWEVFAQFRDPRIEACDPRVDPVNKNAKSVTNGLRLAGGMELIKMASELMIKVNDGAGVKGGIDGLAAYGFQCAEASRNMLFEAHSGIQESSRTWNKSSELECCLPESFYHEISEESVLRAVKVVNRNECIARGLGSAGDSIHKPVGIRPADSTKRSENTDARFKEVVQYVVNSKFVKTELVTLGSIPSNMKVALRTRASQGKGNELDLVTRLQSTGLVKVCVRMAKGGYKFFLEKHIESELDSDGQVKLVEALALFDLDTDQYFTGVGLGDIERDALLESELSPKETTAFLKKFPGFDMFQMNSPPLATQQRDNVLTDDASSEAGAAEDSEDDDNREKRSRLDE